LRVDFSTLPAWVNDIYYKTLWDRRRYNILYGGAGSGKSVFQAQRLVYRLIAEHGHNFLVLRKVGRTTRYSTWALVKNILAQWGLLDLVSINATNFEITVGHNGNQAIFGGLDDREKIKSLTFASGPLTDIWLEEASEFEGDDITQLDLRLRGIARQPFQITLTFNPIISTHPIKGRFIDSPDDKTTILKTTYKDNRFLDSQYREVLEKLKIDSPEYYQVYCLGEWGQLGAVVFTNFVIEEHAYTVKDFDTVYVGLDFGFNHASALEILGIRDGEIYALDEVYARGLSNPELIEEVKKILPPGRQLIVADSAEPDRIKDFRQAGYNITGAIKGPGSLKASIEFLRSHRVHIHKTRCPGLAFEFPIYQYRKDSAGRVQDEPVEILDDAIAAIRYATEGLRKASKVALPKVSAGSFGL
jgi:phage terminase large subunit